MNPRYKEAFHNKGTNSIIILLIKRKMFVIIEEVRSGYLKLRSINTY